MCDHNNPDPILWIELPSEYLNGDQDYQCRNCGHIKYLNIFDKEDEEWIFRFEYHQELQGNTL